MKLHRTSERELYYYFLKNGEKRYMYRHKYYDVLGERREKKKSSFLTKNEALRSLLELKAALLDGNVGPIENSEITVSQLMDLWFETRKRNWSFNTTSIYSNAIKKHIKPLIGFHKINKLNSSTYEREFINELLNNEFKPNSVQRFHNVFKTAMNFAVDEDFINRNRFTKIRIDKDDRLDNFLSPEELIVFLEHSKKHGNITQWTLTKLLAYSGLRKGEAYALAWDNIDFKDKKITVSATRNDDNITKPKTKNSYRTIQLDDIVIKQLKKYRKWCKELKLSFGAHLKESDLIFINDGADPVHHFYINYFFNKLYDVYNLKLKRISPHGLRHTHCTILINNNESPPDIARRLGNTLEMIYRVYSHCFNDKNETAVNTFSNAIRAKSGAE